MFVVTYTTYIDGYVDDSGVSSKTVFSQRHNAVREMRSWTDDHKDYEILRTSDETHLVLVNGDDRIELEVVELEVK